MYVEERKGHADKLPKHSRCCIAFMSYSLSKSHFLTNQIRRLSWYAWATFSKVLLPAGKIK